MEIVNHKVRIEKRIEAGYDFHFEKYFTQGWDLFRKEPVQLILYTLIVLAISIGLAMIPIIGAIGAFVIGPALTGGFYIGLRKIDSGEKVEIGDFFKSFDSIVQLLLLAFISSVLISVGILLLVLPGIWLAVGVILCYPLVLFAKLEFWDSIVLGVKLVSKKWFHFFGLLLILALINFVGAIFFGLGLLITIPFSTGVVYAAYTDIVGFSTADERDITDHLVDDKL